MTQCAVASNVTSKQEDPGLKFWFWGISETHDVCGFSTGILVSYHSSRTCVTGVCPVMDWRPVEVVFQLLTHLGSISLCVCEWMNKV